MVSNRFVDFNNPFPHRFVEINKSCKGADVSFLASRGRFPFIRPRGSQILPVGRARDPAEPYASIQHDTPIQHEPLASAEPLGYKANDFLVQFVEQLRMITQRSPLRRPPFQEILNKKKE